MVDAAASFSRDRSAPAPARGACSDDRTASGLTTSVGPVAEYERRVPAGVIAGPAQMPVWVDAWLSEASRDALLATLSDGNQPLLALPLEVTRRGPFRIAGFMGGTHANGSFPALDASAVARIGREDLGRLCAAIARARPDIDALVLERVAPQLNGIANPLMTLPYRPSPNIALAATLAGGFDAVVRRIGAKRRRKKTRGQIRKFEAAGGFRRYAPSTAGEIAVVVEIFLALKAERFRKLGIRDVFAEPEVRRFFHALFRESLAQDPPPFQLHCLEVAGKVRAVTGGCRLPDRMTCEFGAIVEDDLVHASPGDFLFHENIREACEQGFSLYDFSVGDEFYKRQWCDVEIHQADIMVPLTLKGRAYVAATQSVNAAKTAIKNNQRLWSAVKWLRRRGAGAEPATAPEKSDDD
jgi:CelD/BcsL family acetyltransferase involved in cellulose biosynthesis